MKVCTNLDALWKCWSRLKARVSIIVPNEGGGRWTNTIEEHESRKPNAPQESEEIQANPKVAETGQQLKEEMDDLVDEIDKVLEENAAEFVKNYVQKGGE